MNRLALWLALLLAGSMACADDNYQINVYPCPKAPTAPVLDGKLDDAVWQQAPLVSAFLLFAEDKLAKVQTSFRVLYDDRNLYFAIRCDEPLMGTLAPVSFARDEHAAFHSETIELFIDPDHTHDLYYQLAMSHTGSLYDGRREDVSWNSQTVVKADRGADHWSVEAAVPWADLGAVPVAGKVVGFNLCRDRNLGDKEWTHWSRSKDGFHDPYRFAHLVLSATPEQLARLAPELRRGGRSGPIAVFSAEGFSQQTYSQLAAAGFADLDKLIAGLEAERQRESDSGAAAELGQRLGEYRRQVAQFRAQAEGSLDAATWTRLDVQTQEMIAALRKVIWDARLHGLLRRI